MTVISDRGGVSSSSSSSRNRPLAAGDLGTALAGERLDHFELIEYVGGGGMGAVFRARDTLLNREVALKVLSRDQGADDDTRRRFQNEAQSAARLDHENIARVYFVGEDQGLNYIAFEFILGVNVRDLVMKKGPLSLAEAISYTLQVAEALAHASSRDVVHRDIKPSNIIIAEGGRAKLVDMGLARLHQVRSADEDLTASGVTLGTFDYISPEQARDPRSADVRSDIYSLGCTFYYMLTAQPPFPDGTVLQKLLQHQGDEAPDPRTLRPDLPEAVSTIVGKMLAKEPRKRYQDPSEVVAELLLLANEAGLRARTAGGDVWIQRDVDRRTTWERHLPWLIPTAALVCVFAVLEIFSRVTADPSTSEPPPLPQRVAASLPSAAAAKSTGAAGAGLQLALDVTRNGGAPATQGTIVPDEIASLPRAIGWIPVPAAIPDVSPRNVFEQTTPLGGAASQAGAVGRNGNVAREKSGANNQSTSELSGQQILNPQSLNHVSQNGQPFNPLATYPPSSGNPEIGPSPVGQFPNDGTVEELPFDTIEPSRTESAAIRLKPDILPPVNPTAASAETGGVLAPREFSGNVTDAQAGRTESSVAGTAKPPVAIPMNGSSSPTTSSAAATSADSAPVVVVIDASGERRRSFSSLEAACSAAKNNDVIELQYNGRREAKPITLTNQTLTIRGDARFRPVVVFRPTKFGSPGFATSMITVAGGRLNVVNVALELDIPRDATAESLSLIETRQADEVRLERCWLTIRNAADKGQAYFQGVSFFNIKAAPGANSMMQDKSAPPVVPDSLELKDCVARGQAVFVRSAEQQPFSLHWENGLLATTEQFLLAGGGSMSPPNGARIVIDLRHVTVLAHGGVCKLAGTVDAPYLLAAEVKCVDSILLGGGLLGGHGAAVIEQTGNNRNGNSLQQQFSWTGDHNFCQGFAPFWRIVDLNRAAEPEQISFSKGEVSIAATSAIWSDPPASDRSVDTLTLREFALADSKPDEPMRFEASDGKPAGLDAARMPSPPPERLPADDRASTSAADSRAAPAETQLRSEPTGEASGPDRNFDTTVPRSED